MNNNCNWESILDELEEKGEEYFSFNEFVNHMLGLIEKISQLMPKEILLELKLANIAWSKNSPDISELTNSRVRCWQYLDKNRDTLKDNQVSAIRSLICLLYPKPQSFEEILETIDWFLEFYFLASNECMETKDNVREFFQLVS